MTDFLRRLHYLLRRRQFDRELANDLEFHREMSARNGNIPVGNTLRIREEARDAWGWTWIDRLGQDFRYGARGLRKSPAFAATVILMLAIGIGCNVAVFGFFNLITLQPINVRDPASLVRFHRRSLNQYSFTVPYPEMAFFREYSRTLSAVIGVNSTSVSVDGETRPLDATFVTANFFHELGGECRLGRPLDPVSDERPDAAPVIVLSYGFWQRHFAGDPSIVGHALKVNGKAATIIGVAASGFTGVGAGIGEPAFWASITQQPWFVDGSRLLTDVSVGSPGVSLWGRLAQGQTAKTAEDELHALAEELRHKYPDAIWKDERLPSEAGGYVSSMITGHSRGTGAESHTPIYPIFALAGTLTLLILTVTCSNSGGMLLARAMARRREIAIRAAIGASNGRLIRQFFTESLLLASLGSGAGLLFGIALFRTLLASSGAPAWMNPGLNWRVMSFALAAGAVSAILFGLMPALQIGRQRERTHFARSFLVGAQVTSSCVLLIVAGLVARALNNMASNPPGFEYRQVISISPGLSYNGYSPARSQKYLDTLEQRLGALPGVRSVALALSPPLGHITIVAGTELNGRHVEFQINHVSSGFFETMRIPLLRGRALRPGERHVVVISESMARETWPGEDALGKSITLGDRFMVVGICGDVRAVKFGDSDTVHAYFPIEDENKPSLSILVRTAGSPGDLARGAMSTARQLDQSIFPSVELLSQNWQTNLQGTEYSALAVTAMAAVAQLLACFGIVGMVSYAVSQHTKEIGVHMALGARPAHILSMVLRQLSLPILAGLIAGVAGAAGFSHYLRGRLFGVSSLDPAAYLMAIAAFLATIAIAALVPARRALGIDPLRALRHE